MTVLILLPPLSHSNVALEADTAVTLLHQGQSSVQRLSQAIGAHPKARIVLHPVDAPLLVQTLPPLPQSKRLTALRVVLEDRILSDIQHTVLIFEALGNHQYAVVYCEQSLVLSVQEQLAQLGAAQTLGALSAHLSKGSEQVLDGWLLWSNEQGAGAFPHAGVPNSSAWSMVPSTLTFASYRQHAGGWKQWRTWRWAVYAGLACAVVGLLGQWLYWRTLVQAQDHAQTRINVAFKSVLPQTPQSQDPVKQVQQALNQGGRQDTALSSAMQKVPSSVPSHAVKSFAWNAGRLSLSLSKQAMSLDASGQAALVQNMTSQGITVVWVD